MEAVNKLKELSLNIDTIGLYDEAEEREKMMNSLRAEGEKEGIEKGAKEKEKSIAKNLINMGLSKQDVMKATGLSKKQITMLM